jgi:MFS family permease
MLRPQVELLRQPPARLFFLAHAQSSLGTGAAYVGLLVLAYERFRSPWAISLVLLAELVPAMVLGPLFGAAVDRWSRRVGAVVADLARASAFLALAVVDSFTATVALASMAGAGTALFRPAALAGLPSLAGRTHLAAATSLFGALDDLGFLLGPALAAGILALASPEALMATNGTTFALSALLLARLRFGERPAAAGRGKRRPSLLAEARHGLVTTARTPGVRAVALAASGVLLFAGIFNVAELLLATEELGTTNAGFSLLVAVFGLGIVGGSLSGGHSDNPAALKHGFLLGLLLAGLGFSGSALAPSVIIALATFALAGIGNGLMLVHQRLLLQSMVPDALLGRTLGVTDALSSWAFASSYLAGGAILAFAGVRPAILIAGTGALSVWAATTLALSGRWPAMRRPLPEASSTTTVPTAPAHANEPAPSAESDMLP